jgi:hypothetical protein
MDVVFDAADVVEDSFLGPDDTARERIETLGHVGRDPALAVFGAEYDVQEKLGVGSGQSTAFR